MRRLGEAKSIDRVKRAEKSALNDINARVDGHPQAVGVVISRLKTEPLKIVLEGLPKVLADDIGPILEWSFNLLTSQEREFLLEVSVYEGEVRHYALNAVHIEDYPIPVAELVEKNLLNYDTERELYSLHPLVQEYAYNQLRRERRRKLHRLAYRYFLSEKGKDPVSAIYHIYKAEDWEHGMHATAGIIDILILRGFWTEAKNLCEQGIFASRKIASDKWEVSFLRGLGDMCHRIGDYNNAERLYSETLEISRKSDNYGGASAALYGLAVTQYRRGNYEEATKLYKQSLEIKQKLGDKRGIATSFGALGRLSETRNQLPLAREYYEKALEIFRQLGDKPYTDLAQKDLNQIKTKIKTKNNK